MWLFSLIRWKDMHLVVILKPESLKILYFMKMFANFPHKVLFYQRDIYNAYAWIMRYILYTCIQRTCIKYIYLTCLYDMDVTLPWMRKQLLRVGFRVSARVKQYRKYFAKFCHVYTPLRYGITLWNWHLNIWSKCVRQPRLSGCV